MAASDDRTVVEFRRAHFLPAWGVRSFSPSNAPGRQARRFRSGRSSS